MSDSKVNIDYIQFCKAVEERDMIAVQTFIVNHVTTYSHNISDHIPLPKILCEIDKMTNAFALGVYQMLLDHKILDEREKMELQNQIPQVATYSHVCDNDEFNFLSSNGEIIFNDFNLGDFDDWADIVSKVITIIHDLLNLEARMYTIFNNTSKILNVAIQKNNTLGACFLIRRRTFVGEDFNLSLLEAIKHKNETIAKMLIDHGIQNNLSIDFIVFLNAAISYGQPIMAEYIYPHCQFLKVSDRYISKEAVIGIGPGYNDCMQLLLKWNFTVSPDSNHDGDFVHAAVEKGYLSIFLELLKLGIDVNMVNSVTGLSLLKVACLNKHHEIVENLLKHKVTVNTTTPTNTENLSYLLFNNYIYPSLFLYKHEELHDITCLHIAVLNSDLKMTRLLLEHGATIVDDPSFFNITRIAIRYNCEEIVRLFLDHGVDVNHVDLQGKSLLHYCVSSLSTGPDFRYDIAKLLLERGATNHIHSPSNKLIFNAIKNRYHKIARLFLDYNADIQYVSPSGDTVLLKAIENNFETELIQILLKLNSPVNAINYNKLTPLLIACKNQSANQLEIITSLLHYNADVNFADPSSMTPLHFACQVANLKLVKILLEKGADPNVINDEKQTPLHLLYGPVDTDIFLKDRCNILSITQLLLQYNTNIEAVDARGRTPLLIACESVQEKAVEYLLDNNANVNHTDLENLTPFYLAVKGSYAGGIKAVELLLKRKVNIHCTDKLGNSIIHIIVEHKIEKLFKILASTQINFNTLNKQGSTPLHYAIQKRRIDMVKSLIKYGANVNIMDKENCTPFQKATEYITYHRSKLNDHEFIRMWGKSEHFGGNINWIKNMYIRFKIYPYENIIRILKLHIFKLKIAGLKVNKQNLRLLRKFKGDTAGYNEYVRINYRQFESKCEQELEKMKMESIGVSDMSLFDLLTKSIHSLSRWVKNKKIKSTLELQVYVEKFPIYIYIMRSRFRDAKIRYRMLDSAKKYFSLNICNRLSDDSIDTVFSYLNIKEIKMFIRAFKPLNL